MDKILGLENIDPENLQMHQEFKNPDSPFVAVVSLNSELSLLVDMPKILGIDLIVDKHPFTLDEKLIEMAEAGHE